jgi:hypothetical protein
VRIAVSGTHVTGKSSLVEALGACLPNHRTIPEPYEILEERGYAFAHPPTVDDFAIQLRQSLVTLRRRSANLIFDRCPLDFLGYIYASPDTDRFDLATWRGEIEQAMKSLDLVVAVHVDPTHDPAMPSEESAFRLEVDDMLRDIVDGDSLDLCHDVEILSLAGPWDRRLETVLAHISTLTNRPPVLPLSPNEAYPSHQ